MMADNLKAEKIAAAKKKVLNEQNYHINIDGQMRNY